jgi:hypothetical protein
VRNQNKFPKYGENPQEDQHNSNARNIKKTTSQVKIKLFKAERRKKLSEIATGGKHMLLTEE